MPKEELRSLIDQLALLEQEKGDEGFAEGEAEQLRVSDQSQPSAYAAQINISDAAILLPQDDWERMLLEMGTDCGVSLPDEAFSRESLYP